MAEPVDLCYVISHGFAARMLMQTGLLLQLADAGKTIAIISPDPEDENLQEYARHPRIQVFADPQKNNHWTNDYLFKRKYYLEDLSSNPVLWEKHLYSIFYSKSRHPWKRLRPLYYYVLYRLNKLFPAIRRRFQQNESKYLESRELAALIHKIQPKLVVSTYPVNLLEAKVLYAAKQHKTTSLIHLLSWDNITCKGIFPVTSDYYIAWGEIMYQELKEYYGVADDRVVTCGVPHFDQHIKVQQSPSFTKLLEDLSLHPEHPYLFVAMSAPRFAPREVDIVEQLARWVEADVFGSDQQLIIRPHPQNVRGSLADTSWLKRLDRLQSRRVAIDYPQLVDSRLKWSMKKQDMERLSNLLAGCSVCLNSGSTVSIDALMLDKPVVLTSFDGESRLNYWKSARRLIDYPHLKKFVALGGARVTLSFGELKQVLLDYIQQPDLDRAQRKRALEKECFKNDGRATERVVEAVLNLLTKSECLQK